MKKAKLLGLVLAGAIMLMGAGYAQWTDVLKVENTVSTGDMNVEFIDEGAYSYNDDYMTAAITRSVDNKTETVEITNMYPGSVAVYNGVIENKGTLPAEIQGVEVSIDKTLTTNSAALADRMVYAAGYVVFDANGNAVPGKSGFVMNADLDNLQNNLNAMLKDEVLEPGEKLYFDIPEDKKNDVIAQIPEYANLDDNCFVFSLPYNVVNSENLENEQIDFDITVNFGQENGADATSHSTNLDNAGSNK